MMHKMNLDINPFNHIKRGTKTIELRLYDEKGNYWKKRIWLSLQTFEKLMVEVERLYKYSSFDELYKYFDKIAMGYDENDIANPKDMEKYYSKEEQNKYGGVAIKIKVIKN